MTQHIGKYSPHHVFSFAFAAVALGIGAAFATQGLGPKVTSAVYAGIVGLAGFGSTYLTRAGIGRAVLGFILAALAAAIVYYLLVSSIFAQATGDMADLASGGQAHAQGQEAAGVMGRFFGAFAAIVTFLETSIVGIVGAVAGAKARGQVGSRAQAAGAR